MRTSAPSTKADTAPIKYHDSGQRSRSRYPAMAGKGSGLAAGAGPCPGRRGAWPVTPVRVALPAVSNPGPVRDQPTTGGRAPAGPRPVTVSVQRLDPGVPLPSYALPGDVGADIVTTVDAQLAPGERAALPTGIALALPDGYAAFVHPRSGLAARAGMTLLNAPGTIDSGYRGEVTVIVVNHDPRQTLRLQRGDRIAQLVVQRVEPAMFVEVSALPPSVRGSGKHGSTGGVVALEVSG